MTKIQQLPSDYARTKISEIYKDKNEKFISFFDKIGLYKCICNYLLMLFI